MPYFEPSRPIPLSFMPPKGAISVEMMPSLMPTMPYSRASATRQMRPMSRLWARISGDHFREADRSNNPAAARSCPKRASSMGWLRKPCAMAFRTANPWRRTA
jgi:hypothetical protein